MAIDLSKFGSIPNLDRSVHYAESKDGTKVRASSVVGDHFTRKGQLTVNADGSATRTSNLTTKSGFSRQVSVTSDGQGNVTRSVDVTLASGKQTFAPVKQISRDTSLSKSTDADGNTVVAVNRTVNGLSGVRTFVGDISSSSITGVATYTDASGAVSTHQVDYHKVSGGPIPVNIPTALRPIPVVDTTPPADPTV